MCVYSLLNGTQSASTPVIAPASETMAGPIRGTITDSTPGATISYTTDGTQPTVSSNVYTGPISVTPTETVNAIASANNFLHSAMASASFTFSSQTDAPSFTPPGGSYTSAQTVTISDPTAGVQVYYTTDGSTPTSSSTHYTAPFGISNSTTVKAIGIANGFSNSPVAVATYLIQQSGTAVNFSQGFSQSQSLNIPMRF